MANCCDTKRYDAVFSEKRARSDLKRYRKKGPAKTTQLLIDAVKGAGVQRATLLDIGGGIGAISHELLAAGAEAATEVEAADAFVQAARDEATRRGHEARIRFVSGDFVALASEIPSTDIVTLDRVICCYPNMEQLVTASLARARRTYGIVIPRARRLTSIMSAGINLVFRLTRNPFRFFVHAPTEIERLIGRAGFVPHSVKDTAVWRVAVYKRT